MSPTPRKTTFNLNSALSVATLTGMLGTGIFFIAPLKTMPGDMKLVRGDVTDVQRTQAVQTEALKTLAEVAKDSRDLRRDYDRTTAESSATLKRHDYELEQVRRKLDKLEP
jgi:hypothetical protein